MYQFFFYGSVDRALSITLKKSLPKLDHGDFPCVLIGNVRLGFCLCVHAVVVVNVLMYLTLIGRGCPAFPEVFVTLAVAGDRLLINKRAGFVFSLPLLFHCSEDTAVLVTWCIQVKL